MTMKSKLAMFVAPALIVFGIGGMAAAQVHAPNGTPPAANAPQTPAAAAHRRVVAGHAEAGHTRTATPRTAAHPSAPAGSAAH